MQTIKKPFTDKQVENINFYQQHGEGHPFTCCSPEDIKECQRTSGKSEGLLVATNDGLICPCGLYKQDWCYAFMAEPRQNHKI